MGADSGSATVPASVAGSPAGSRAPECPKNALCKPQLEQEGCHMGTSLTFFAKVVSDFCTTFVGFSAMCGDSFDSAPVELDTPLSTCAEGF